MTRGQNVTRLGLIFLVVWIIALLSPLSKDEKKFNIIMGFPGYCLICFGCWALVSIGNGISTLKSYPSEHKLLLEDIKRAQENVFK